jgi:hypothetical protein
VDCDAGSSASRASASPDGGVARTLDAVIVALTWREYRRQRRSPNDRSSGTAAVTSAAQVVER